VAIKYELSYTATEIDEKLKYIDTIMNSYVGTSPIAGKRIAMIGDSNTQYNGAYFKEHMESTYGCTFMPLGYAGATWETSNGIDTTDNNAVGRVNKIIANVDEDKLITEYDMVIFMMGTNCSNVGTPTDKSDNVTTMCGAMRYCMEKMCYYGRRIAIGVIIPFTADYNYNANSRKGNTLPEKFQYIKQIAEEFGVPTLDLYNSGRIIPDGQTPDGRTYYLGDSVHLGGNGGIHINRIMGKWIAYQL
jgi:flavodoxin